MPSIRQSIRSSTASKRPTSAIADGQIALNTASGTPGIFFKDSAGNIVKAGPAHYGATAPNSSPAVGGSTGNSFGEAWLDISLTPAGWKIWNGSAWVNATPLSSDTVQGLVELATNAETQAGVDAARAVTAASLQSKVSDSISTTSASGIASSTAVKTAYDLANAALPKSGGIVTGNLEIGSTGSFTFEGATADGFETTLAVVDPTADRTITFPNITGTVVTTGDTGTVTSTMILDGTILNADINASAAIVDTKLATIATALKVSNSATTAASTNTASAIVARDASGNFIAGTITAALTGAASSNVLKAGDTMTGALIVPSGTVTANGIQVGTGTTYKPGIYSPGTDQLAISTGGTSRIVFDASGNVNIDSNTFYVDAANNRVGLGTTGPTESLHTTGALRVTGVQTTAGTGIYLDQTSGVGNVSVYGPDASTQGTFRIYTATSNGGTGSAKLTVDSSGRVGIGTTSPGQPLDISAAQAVARLTSTTGTNYCYSWFTNTAGTAFVGIESSAGGTSSFGAAPYALTIAHQGAYPINFSTNNTLKATIDSSGNMGIGVVPSVFSVGKAIEIGHAGNALFGATSGQFNLMQNVNYNADFKYVNTAAASYYQQLSGAHIWYTAVSGTAGTTATFSERLRITNAGLVGIGTSSPTNTASFGQQLQLTGNLPCISIDNTGTGANKYSLGVNGSGALGFWDNTASAYRMYINSSGSVGIGTTGPANALQVVSGSNYVASFNTSTISASSSAVVIGNYLNNGGGASGGAIRVYHNHGAGTATSMAFEVNGATEAIRIDDQRRLLVGTSSTSGNGCLIQSRNDSTGLALELQRSSDNASAAALFLTKSRGTQGSPTEVSNGDQLGVIAFSGHDGAGYKDAAYIIAEADGTWTDGGDTTDNPGRLVFSTTADGAASPTERMRITNAGNILINTTSTYSASVCTTDFNSASQFGLTLRDTGSATDAVMMYFYKSGNVRGNITTTATATAFNTSSDYRLKRDVVPIENASSRVQQLRPVNFAWEETGSRCDGFLAHEAQAVVPECVTGEKDAVDEDGNPVYQGIDQSKLVPLLTAALQEAIAKIEALETRLSALEAA